jgi:hypothetical protein
MYKILLDDTVSDDEAVDEEDNQFPMYNKDYWRTFELKSGRPRIKARLQWTPTSLCRYVMALYNLKVCKSLTHDAKILRQYFLYHKIFYDYSYFKFSMS